MENQLATEISPPVQSSRVKIFVILFVVVVCLITGVFVFRGFTKTVPVPSAALQLPPVFANQDKDLDGLSDGEEVQAGTDSQKADTDADGLSDGYEVRESKTDPKNPHSKDAKLTDSEWLTKDTPRR